VIGGNGDVRQQSHMTKSGHKRLLRPPRVPSPKSIQEDAKAAERFLELAERHLDERAKAVLPTPPRPHKRRASSA